MVRRIISGALGVAALVIMLSASPALADKDGKGGAKHAPEFDIAAAGAVAAIVTGGGILLARRRRN